MICKNCGREIPENSLYCNWCGEKQIKERRKKDEIKVPTPKQLPSGNWRIVLRAEDQSITEATPELCIAKAKAIRAGFVKKQAKSPAITLSTAIDNYIAVRDKTLSPSSIRSYRIYQHHRFQSVMNRPIGKITNWQEICNSEATLCSAKTLKSAYGFICSVLSENGVRPQTVKLPQIVKAERPWLEPEQIPVFLEAVCGTQVEIPALLALCSLRRSEICALTWDKIDLEKDTITVSGAVVPDENNKFVAKKTNKNQSSRRVVPILIPQLKVALEAVEEKEGNIYKGNPNTIGHQINRICKAKGLPLVCVHGLRHSFASLAYHLGLSQLETMQIGGWSDTKTMQGIYTHLALKDKQEAITKMGSFFENCTRNAPANSETIAPKGF